MCLEFTQSDYDLILKFVYQVVYERNLNKTTSLDKAVHKALPVVPVLLALCVIRIKLKSSTLFHSSLKGTD